MPNIEKTRKHLINLHNSDAATLERIKKADYKNGEIVVQHGSDASSSAIHILNNEQTNVVTFVPKGQDDSYLGKTAKAADSELLDGKDSAHFATAEGLTNLTARVTAAEGQIVENSKVSAAGIAQNKTAIDANTASIEANASEISGLDARLTTTEGEINALQAKKMVDSFGGVTGDVTLKAEDLSNGSINLKMSGNELQASIEGLGSAAYTESTDYIQGVNADGTYLSASDDTNAQNRKISANVATKEEIESGTANKLTSAAGVKDYVEGKVSADKLDTVTISGKVTGTGTRSGNSLTINATSVTLASSDIPELATEKITALTGFADASEYADVSATDSLNTALGKLSKGHKIQGEKLTKLESAISGGTFFAGVIEGSVLPSTENYKNGDIIALKGTGIEYILHDNKGTKEWIELGNSTADQQRISTLEGYFDGNKAKESKLSDGVVINNIGNVRLENTVSGVVANHDLPLEKGIGEGSLQMIGGNSSGSASVSFNSGKSKNVLEEQESIIEVMFCSSKDFFDKDKNDAYEFFADFIENISPEKKEKYSNTTYTLSLHKKVDGRYVYEGNSIKENTIVNTVSYREQPNHEPPKVVKSSFTAEYDIIEIVKVVELGDVSLHFIKTKEGFDSAWFLGGVGNTNRIQYTSVEYKDFSNIASGNSSFASGINTIASGEAAHVDGKYNVDMASAIHMVGVGTAENSRKNAHTITTDGKHYIPGIGGYVGTETDLSSVKDLATVLNEMTIDCGEY